ncbi:MAG TPA: DUF418 domain-containing protein [Burkholderiales bacterium]|nr:DUF418 domain-containing protein [Burkholderiales bacterium]
MQKKERIEIIDILRGFAMLGVIMVNFIEMNTAPGDGLIFSLYSIIDKISYTITHLLFFNKSYIIFAFLFGYNLHILQQNIIRKKVYHVAVLVYQRLLVIFILGLIQTSLLWWGTIIMLYAFYGIFSYLFIKNISKYFQLIIALIILFIVPIIIDQISLILNPISYVKPQEVTNFFNNLTLDDLQEFYASWNFYEIIRTNLIFWFYEYYGSNIIINFIYNSQMIGLIILGYACSGYKMLEILKNNEILFGIKVSVGGYIILHLFNRKELYYSMSLLQNLMFSAAVIFIIMFIARTRLIYLISWLKVVGKSSFSFYVMHMVFADWIFHFLISNSKLYFYQIEILAVMIFILLFFINRLVLNKLGIGIFELLLRKLTYLARN